MVPVMPLSPYRGMPGTNAPGAAGCRSVLHGERAVRQIERSPGRPHNPPMRAVICWTRAVDRCAQPDREATMVVRGSPGAACTAMSS